MFGIIHGAYTLICLTGALPERYEDYCRHAELLSEYDLLEPKETYQGESPCFVGVSKIGYNDGWPFLVIAQNYSPDSAGFHPGAIIISETNVLMLGAGTRLLAYALDPPRLLWEDSLDFGFWGWQQHNSVVVMAAETGIAAWDAQGNSLWSRYAEPPWSYHVEEGIVHLDIMGSQSSFPLLIGPDG